MTSDPRRLVDFVLAADVNSEGYQKALNHADQAEWVGMLVLADHPESDVRRALVSTLPFLIPDPPDEVVATVIHLTADAAIAVRDQACFVLAQQWREIDTAPLRDALAERLNDLDRDTRCEALVGLAYRHDHRAGPRVRAALSRHSGDVWRLELVAAGALGDVRLHPLVLRHLDGWDEKDSQTVDAVRRLTDPNGPGSDLFRGVAALYRHAAHGRQHPPSVRVWQLMDEMLDIAPERAQEFFDEVATRLADDAAALDQLRTQSALSTMLESALARRRFVTPPVSAADISGQAFQVPEPLYLVFEAGGHIYAFETLHEAHETIESMDLRAGHYLAAYSDQGEIITMSPGELWVEFSASGRFDPAGLGKMITKSRSFRELTDDPHRFALVVRRSQ